MKEKRASEILTILRHTSALPHWVTSKTNSFETLVTAIISQNTTDKNAARAIEDLSKYFELTPEVLAKIELARLEQCIRLAGLCKRKARAIRKVSKTVQEEYHGKLEPILSLPLEEARKTLLQFPGVGRKTADIVLLFSARQPTIPVDTHVNRVAKRLGLTRMNGAYESVRGDLQSLFNPRDYLTVHLSLIAHGRKYCKARRPLCDECPISIHCPSKGPWTKH